MSKKLLLADDSITIQKVIQITFAHEDYQLTITDNGDTAFVRAEELVPDLVLADVYMPGKNGYELCAAIKQSPALQHVPVLLLAGSFEPFDEAKARTAGADAWIEKPFESQALIDKVAELLGAVPAASAAAETLPPVVEPKPAAETVEPFADFLIEETPAAATLPEEFVFEELATAEPNFEFIDEASPAEGAQPSAFEASPAVATAFSGFDAGEEILPLGDDDILGAEDFEPVAEISTLTPWSRDEVPADELFPAFAELELPPVGPVDQSFTAAEPMTESVVESVAQPAAEPVAVLAPEPVVEPTAEPVVEPATEPVIESAAEPVIESAAEPVIESAAESVVASTAEPVAEAAGEPVTIAAQQCATVLTAEELELIVERAVARALEKLAGTVLERVAWEVVPDLAETLIKEEIRQIKEAAV
jgi:CheY-like chemotaxis protein